MAPVFLGGGGWTEDVRGETYGRFVEAVRATGGRSLAVVIAEEAGLDGAERVAQFRTIFTAVGAAAEEIAGILVSETTPLTRDALAAHRPGGLFVGGGLTPLYQQALCVDQRWLDYVRAENVVYGGFSAGAAIAADRTIVGGWKVRHDGRDIVIGDENASEDLELIEVRPGLGLAPFAVDGHASQWGNLTRLIHAVAGGLVVSGWAIDEDTLLEVAGGAIRVHGAGHAYRVQSMIGRGAQVELFRAGAHVPTD